MSHSKMMRAGVRALLNSVLLTVVFGTGALAGVYLYPRAVAESGHDHESDHAHEDESDHSHEEDDHVALTEQAFGNLNLRLGLVSKADYWKTLLVPARVVEIPGKSDLSVSSPVTGVIEELEVVSGQSIAPGAPLFLIRLTDEALIDAQSKLLESLTRQEVAQQEVARLTPLIETGAVSATRKRDLEYELKQLKAQQSSLLQELSARGLPEATIAKLLKDRALASTLTVHAPSFIEPNQIESESMSGCSVEELLVHPGKSVSRGESLCTVANHSKLYLEGTAFEDDLPVLNKIAENNWQVEVELHNELEYDQASIHLPLLRVDNQIDQETQTVKFFVELTNEVTRKKDVDSRVYEQWRFRPGQKMHVRLPVEYWEDQITLPVEAVVVDGPNAFVFAEHHHDDDHAMASDDSSVNHDHHDHDHQDDDPHDDDPHDDHHDDEHEPFIEFEPIPVRLLYRDDRTVVVADDGQIPHDESIAMNNAYKLYLAMKMQAGGGGGHHHHDH